MLVGRINHLNLVRYSTKYLNILHLTRKLLSKLQMKRSRDDKYFFFAQKKSDKKGRAICTPSRWIKVHTNFFLVIPFNLYGLVLSLRSKEDKDYAETYSVLQSDGNSLKIDTFQKAISCELMTSS